MTGKMSWGCPHCGYKLGGTLPEWLELREGLTPIRADCPKCGQGFDIYFIVETNCNPGHFNRIHSDIYRGMVDAAKRKYQKKWKREADLQARRELAAEAGDLHFLKTFPINRMGKS
jgi:hypothetical protein